MRAGPVNTYLIGRLNEMTSSKHWKYSLSNANLGQINELLKRSNLLLQAVNLRGLQGGLDAVPRRSPRRPSCGRTGPTSAGL